jgi:hypothetical protein
MIRVLIPFVALFAQVPVAPGDPLATPAQPADEAPAEPVVLDAWPGTVGEAFAAIRKHAEAHQLESARLIADRLLAPNGFLRWKREFAARGGWRARTIETVQPAIDWLALDGLDDGARAEVWFARGVVDTLAKARPEAEADFEAARGGATDRALRHDAIYDLGGLALDEGEEIRATLPEISGKPPMPPLPLPTPPAGGPGAPEEPPDPIELARAAYLKARGHYVERLKSDWRDVDTQKNVELCLKRLRELDQIEKKREEEKQKQQQQQQQDQKDQKSDSKDDPKPQDPKPEDEPQPKPPEDKPEDKPEPKQPDEKQAQKPEDAEPQPMSREEMTQLLDRLKQLEEEHKKIQAQLKAARRGKVKKDW